VSENSNIGHLCADKQCEAGLTEHVAFRWLGSRGERMECTFGNLQRETARFANVLDGLGYKAGEVFFTFLPKVPEQFFAFLGSLKMRLITGTLFSNFGGDALLDRLGDCSAKGIITRRSFLKKLRPIRDRLPALRHIIVVDGEDNEEQGVLAYRSLMGQAAPSFVVPDTDPETPSVLHYSSGSTGKPKGVLHRHRSIGHQRRTAQEVLDLRPDDIYWCTADQGWVTGTSYGIIGPWSLGVTQIHYDGPYDAERWMQILSQEGVTVWYTAPTALRMLMRQDDGLFRKFDLSRLRHVCSVGEPLNPEAIHWGRKVLGKEIHDTWWQTETGGIMISNRPGLPIRPGSMGKPVVGIEAAAVASDGTPVPDGQQGNLCLRPGWDSMFISYFNHEAVYREKFRHGWYFTGDAARRDADGYFWFVGRTDDVINTAGHLVSPFEVESALLEIDEIVESGVIGAPDDILFEKIVAFVVLAEGCQWSTALELKVRMHVANRVSSVATPQQIIVIDAIPKNKSGKIMRRLLKARFTGTDPGDLSTLDT